MKGEEQREGGEESSNMNKSVISWKKQLFLESDVQENGYKSAVSRTCVYVCERGSDNVVFHQLKLWMYCQY